VVDETLIELKIELVKKGQQEVENRPVRKRWIPWKSARLNNNVLMQTVLVWPVFITCSANISQELPQM